MPASNSTVTPPSVYVSRSGEKSSLARSSGTRPTTGRPLTVIFRPCIRGSM